MVTAERRESGPKNGGSREPGNANDRKVLWIILCFFSICLSLYYFLWFVSYGERSFRQPHQLAYAINIAVFFGEEQTIDKAPINWCDTETTKKLNAEFANKFRTYPTCSLVLPASSRRNCDFWWLGRSCLTITIIKSTYDIPRIKKLVDDAIKFPCKYIKLSIESRLKKYSAAAFFLFGDGSNVLGCRKYTERNAFDVFLKISGRTKFFPTQSNSALINRTYAWIGGSDND